MTYKTNYEIHVSVACETTTDNDLTSRAGSYQSRHQDRERLSIHSILLTTGPSLPARLCAPTPNRSGCLVARCHPRLPSLFGGDVLCCGGRGGADLDQRSTCDQAATHPAEGFIIIILILIIILRFLFLFLAALPQQLLLSKSDGISITTRLDSLVAVTFRCTLPALSFVRPRLALLTSLLNLYHLLILTDRSRHDTR